MFATPAALALMLGLIFVFLIDISFNLRRVNRNIMKFLKKYEDVQDKISK